MTFLLHPLWKHESENYPLNRYISYSFRWVKFSHVMYWTCRTTHANNFSRPLLDTKVGIITVRVFSILLSYSGLVWASSFPISRSRSYKFSKEIFPWLMASSYSSTNINNIFFHFLFVLVVFLIRIKQNVSYSQSLETTRWWEVVHKLLRVAWLHFRLVRSEELPWSDI